MSEEHHDTHVEEPKANPIASALAIIGSVILIIIILWGLIHLLSLSSGFITNFFGGGSSKLEVVLPAEAASGTLMPVKWTYTTKEKGSYAFIYPCSEGFAFSLPAADDTYTALPCGAAYTLGGATNGVSVMPLLVGTSSLRTPISILFIPSGEGAPIEGVGTVLIKSAAPAVTSVVEVKPEATPPVQTATPSYSGPADLSVTIVSVYIDQFGNGNATFNISNIGASPSGAYTFTAQLPTAQPYTYYSPAQSSLAPGSYIVNTLTFTQAISGNVDIVVDPSNSVRENNEGNNIASQYVAGTYQNNYQYNYPQPYYQY